MSLMWNRNPFRTFNEKLLVNRKVIKLHRSLKPHIQKHHKAISSYLISLYKSNVTVHGFPVPSSPCLVCVHVRMCEQVSVGVCDWGWFAPAESHHRWAISVPVMLSLLSDPCSVCGRRLRSVLVPRFLSPAAFLDSISWALLLSWTPIAGDSSAHCFPVLPASAFEELHFSFSHCITSCNKLSFPQLNPPVFIVTEGSDQSSWIQRRLVVCRNC